MKYIFNVIIENLSVCVLFLSLYIICGLINIWFFGSEIEQEFIGDDKIAEILFFYSPINILVTPTCLIIKLEKLYDLSHELREIPTIETSRCRISSIRETFSKYHFSPKKIRNSILFGFIYQLSGGRQKYLFLANMNK